MTSPRATYRLQLNSTFTFADARALVPYLHSLGISHAYLSPILRARSGSPHGYDTVDHTSINPELGTLADFRDLVAALRQHDMGVILDFVPNHIGVGGADNALWLDVLKHGAASHYATWFDIDWHPPRAALTGKVLVPFLGASYAATLTAGELCLRADGDDFAVWAYNTEKLPIRPEDTAMLLGRYGTPEAALAAHRGENGKLESWAALDSLIATQHWRLAHFAVAADEINYRRFFINSELAGINIDQPEVFEHAHALIFSLIGEGLVDGLRIDHVDGLLDPKGYLETLQARSPRPIYLLIEKILAPHESLRPDWPVDGTTGYEVGAQLTRLLVPAGAEAQLTAAYQEFAGDITPPAAEAHRCKLRIMDNELAAELGSLSRHFAAIAWSVATTSDITEFALRRALREILAHLAVYRTYLDGAATTSRDRREIGRAIKRARRSQPQIQPTVFDFVAALLCGSLGPGYNPGPIATAQGRFQQLSSPVMAKGLEDTALYRYNRLVALNEVGAHPDRFSLSIAAFHDNNLRRLATHPSGMVATSTHDTKRGEDIRAVIASIADAPEDWIAAVNQWRAALAPHSQSIHANDLYLFFQMLLGGWPLEAAPDGLSARLQAAMVKSIREARERSDWAVNATGYEAVLTRFIADALANTAFLSSFHTTREKFHPIGRRKALIQTALKLTIPGVPDIYRGAEDWEQSFVDPDNRRPLDFAALAQRLAAPLPGRDDKLVLTQALLRLRRHLPQLFSNGSYEPMDCGPQALGFRRRLGDDAIVVLADLSPGHASGIDAIDEILPTIVGSASGPLWVMATLER